MRLAIKGESDWDAVVGLTSGVSRSWPQKKRRKVLDYQSILCLWQQWPTRQAIGVGPHFRRFIRMVLVKAHATQILVQICMTNALPSHPR